MGLFEKLAASKHADRYSDQGGTVTFAVTQFAYYMGFSQVILIDMDPRFNTTGPAVELL